MIRAALNKAYSSCSLGPSWTCTMSLQCPELWMIPRAADTMIHKTVMKSLVHFSHFQRHSTRSVLPPPLNLLYPQGPCLPQIHGNAWELRSCYRNLTDKKSCSSVNHENIRSHHLFIVRAQGVGAYPTMHCQKETPRSGCHPSLGSLFVLLYVTWMSLDCGIVTRAPSEKL